MDHQNKAGYTAIMLAALTAAEGPEDMEVAQHLLSLGNINARAGQVGTYLYYLYHVGTNHLLSKNTQNLS